MFYVNNEQIKGIFLNGMNLNYLSYGFGKIIPEDRTAEQLNLNLAYKYLNQYRVEFGTVKDGYENALVSPRFDKPDSNGIFHTPFTYYYNGNIISTKQVPVLITDGNYALSNALVYSDMNINGAINYFATNTDFQGHNVNVFPEKDNYQAMPLLNYEMLSNCSNFDLNINTRFSKAAYPTLYNCNNFSGNFRYVGNSDNNYPGFRGFLYQCKDGVFNIDCTNMHGGGNDANVRNYFNFSGIQNCENMNVNITGSSWQVWPHDHSFTSNCNINTYNVISGFSYMNNCNFNVVLPKDSNPEMSQSFEFLNNAENCNYKLIGTDCNISNFYSGFGGSYMFENLNDCNLNLLLNNSVAMDKAFGTHLNNCNIVFDNLKAGMTTYTGWTYLYNCNITGNVESDTPIQGFIGIGDGLNVNINAAKSSRILPLWNCDNVKGNISLGTNSFITFCRNLNINVYNGNLNLEIINNSNITLGETQVSLYSSDNVMFSGNNLIRIINCNNITASYTYDVKELYDLRNVHLYTVGTNLTIFRNLNSCNIIERTERSVRRNIDSNNIVNCHISLNSMNFNIISNVYNSTVNANQVTSYIDNAENSMFQFIYGTSLKTNNVYDCTISHFPTSSSYTSNCMFRNLPSSQSWNNIWGYVSSYPSCYSGVKSTSGMSNCAVNYVFTSYKDNANWHNVNNMQTDLGSYYENSYITLPNHNMGIKLNIMCGDLTLNIQRSGPPHGFADSSVSANRIFAKGNNANAEVRLHDGCKCFAKMSQVKWNIYTYFNNVNQPVLVVNNARIIDGTIIQQGGISYYGNLSSTGYSYVNVRLNNGACMFVNNAKLRSINVNNALLFLGTNVTTLGGRVVENGGYVCNKANYNMSKLAPLLYRDVFCWNTSDKGPWGDKTLRQLCMDV